MDLVGFGKSDKPEIGYTLQEHQTYVDGFIAALELEDNYEFEKQNKAFKFTKSKVGKDNVYYLSLLQGMGHLYQSS